MKCAAIIPARGGSKGVRLKNLRKVGGSRLLVRSILAARRCDLISDVYVSTDCAEIAYVAVSAGAKVIVRPDELSTDEASSESAILHVLSELDKTGDLPDFIAFLQCTSPFTSHEEIRDVLEPLIQGTADSTFSSRPSHRFIWRSSADGTVHGANHDHLKQRARRQDLAPEHLETGAIYGFRATDFIEKRNRFFGRIMAVETRSSPVEIDSMEDFTLAHQISGPQRRLPVAHSIPKVLITDFDGVHTDGRVLVMQDGGEAVVCNRRDGMGIEIARRNGMEILILSKEKNPVVDARATKLGVECIRGCDDKLTALETWLKSRNLHWDDIAYVGDDVNDLECLQLAGLSICPADAVPIVREYADLRLTVSGGAGCIREIVDHFNLW